MHLLHSFLFTVLPFLAAASPLVEPEAPQARTITIPISRRSFNLNQSQTLVQNSVGKIQLGMAAFQKNTGTPHSLVTGIKTANLTKRSSSNSSSTNSSSTNSSGTNSSSTNSSSTNSSSTNSSSTNSSSTNSSSTNSSSTNSSSTNSSSTNSSSINSSSSNGVVPLSNQGDTLWFGTISVGTPPVNYTVDFDTGSSDLFLPSSSCGSSCSGHKLYDPSASSTAKDLGTTFTLSYGDGSQTSGEQFSDDVTIVGLTAKSQVLGAANVYDGFDPSRFTPDGLLGLAFESISQYGANPTFQTLQSQGLLANPIFGFNLGPSGAGSALTIGGVDPKYDVLTDFTQVPITPGQGFWQASFDELTLLGNSDSAGQILGSTQVIFDTGTTMIIGDPSGIASLYDALAEFGAQPAPDLGDGIYSIPCDFNTVISFSFRGTTVDISPFTFNLGATDNPNVCMAGAAASESLTGGFWILGDVFLQNVYTSWNFGNRNIGFAKLK